MSSNIIRKSDLYSEYFTNIIDLINHFYKLKPSDKKMLLFILTKTKYNTYSSSLNLRFTIVDLLNDPDFPINDRRTIRYSLRRIDKMPFFSVSQGTNMGYRVTVNRELLRGNVNIQFRFRHHDDKYSNSNTARIIKYKNIVIPQSTTNPNDIIELTLKCGNILYEHI